LLRIAANALLIIGALTIVVGLIKKGPEPETPDQRRLKTCTDTSGAKITAFVFAQEFVTRILKAPATAKYPSYTENGVQVLYKGNCDFAVLGFVDAQNSFGALIRSKFIVELRYSPEDDRWSRISANII
jgi:hypothetical protein